MEQITMKVFLKQTTKIYTSIVIIKILFQYSILSKGNI